DLGLLVPNGDAFVSLTVSVQTDASDGYQLSVDDADSSDGLVCSSGPCIGAGIVDWTGTPASPTVWAAGVGSGITVRHATSGGRDPRWGPGTGTSETDIADNYYAGVPATAAQIHRRTGYL